MVLGLCGCYTKEDKEFEKIYKKQAKENAINYIENKYGFTPKFISAHCLKMSNDIYTNTCNGNHMSVQLEYNNKIFYVDIIGNEVSIEGKDNYQSEEIVASLMKLLPDSNNIYIYRLYYREYGNDVNITNGINLSVNTYYDGNNLSDVLKDVKLLGVFEYVNHDRFENMKNNLISSYPMFEKMFIINFKSIADYNAADTMGYNLSGTYNKTEEIINDNSPYIKDAILKDYDRVHYYNFE